MENEILDSIKTLLEDISGFKGNVYIGIPQRITRKKYVNIVPIDVAYAGYDGIFTITVMLTNSGSKPENRIKEIIADKELIRQKLENKDNMPSCVTYIRNTKADYVVDINEKQIYISGADLTFEIGIVKGGIL